MAAQQNDAVDRQMWEKTVKAFFKHSAAEGTDYQASRPLMAALDAEVRAIAAEKPDMDGDQILAEAHKSVMSQFGRAAPAKKADQKPDLSRIPPSIGGAPAAETASTGSSEFAYLDKLSGMALEDAMARLTPAQQDRLLGL
jgi:hypothetical protein